MKHILLTISILFMAAQDTFAQGYGISIYSQNGEKFELYTNYRRKTPQPANEATVYGFKRENIRLRIDFENEFLPDINQNITLKYGSVSRYKIVSFNRRSAQLVFDGYEAYPEPEDEQTTSIIIIKEQDRNYDPYPRDPYKHPHLNTYNQPVDYHTFILIADNIRSLSFDSEKLERGKRIVESNVLTSAQIMEIVKSFDFDSKRLEFAKYAYSYVYDKNMYFLVNGAFDFPSSGRKLDEYIAGIK